jgi:endonuclease/exonuclease/phosphatase family metal-dependent hydrolase
MIIRKFLLLFVVLMTACWAQAQEISVITYNVRYSNNDDTNAGNGWATRKTYLMNLVNFQQPDLLGVQEATKGQMTDLDAGLKAYGRIGVGRNDGKDNGEHSAIFYKKDRMMMIDHGDFWLSDTPDEPSKGFPSKGGSTKYYRICTWGKFIDKATSSYIYYFNTHMDLDETNRQQSYYLIRKKIQEIAGTLNAPVIISGDYNAVQTGDAYKLFYNSGFLYDCFHRAKQKFMTNGTCPGFNACNYSTVSGELRRIDHIFVTKNFDVNHYGVLNPCYFSTAGTADYHQRAYSDHSPVVAKLSIKIPDIAELDTVQPPIVNNIYQISTARELQAYASIVNGLSKYEHNTAAKAVLLNDIDMAEVANWTPIGTSGSPFAGIFNGQGHAIHNILINTSKSYSGLFGATSGATIRDFKLSGTLTVKEGTGEHGIIGYASGSTIRDVHSSLNINTGKANTDTKHVGGVVGSLFNSSIATRCSFTGTISDSGSNTIGGIAGYADQTANTISYCINYGTVQSEGASTNTGGILGYVNHDGFKMSYCANVGSVSGNKEYAGQLVGRQAKKMSTLPTFIYYMEGEQLEGFGTTSDATTAKNATLITRSDIARGELTAQLNRGKTSATMIFFQNINEGEQSDPYPLFTGLPEHKIVYTGTFGKKKSSTDTVNYNFYVNDGGHLPELSLIDAFTSSVAFIADHVSYSFQPANAWGTIYMPFAVTSTQDIQFYDIAPEQTSNTVLTITPCTTLQAYTPGMFHISGNTFSVEAEDVPISVPPIRTSFNFGDFTLTGTFAKKTSYSGGYILSGDVFQYSAENVTTDPFQAALTTANGTPEEITLFISDADGIKGLSPDPSLLRRGEIYYLSGQRLSKPLKGINIVKGKKVLY